MLDLLDFLDEKIEVGDYCLMADGDTHYLVKITHITENSYRYLNIYRYKNKDDKLGRTYTVKGNVRYACRSLMKVKSFDKLLELCS